MGKELEEQINAYVRRYYWEDDINCARTMLLTLCNIFNLSIELETANAAIGLHGAGGYRAQCGLVEGCLMFLGVYGTHLGLGEEKIVSLCYQFASEFEQKFKSLKCYHLRPTGFKDSDPPHMCETLTCEAIYFAHTYIVNSLS